MSSMVGRTPNAKSPPEDEKLVFSSIPSAKRPTASNTYPAMVLARGTSDLSIASEEARSRNLVIPSRRACRPGQWPCGGIRPKPRRVCACRVGGCWPDLRHAHFGWRTRVVDGSATPHAVGAHRRFVVRAQPVDLRRIAWSFVSDRVHAELGRGNSGHSVEAASDGPTDAPCSSCGQNTMTTVPQLGGRDSGNPRCSSHEPLGLPE